MLRDHAGLRATKKFRVLSDAREYQRTNTCPKAARRFDACAIATFPDRPLYREGRVEFISSHTEYLSFFLGEEPTLLYMLSPILVVVRIFAAIVLVWKKIGGDGQQIQAEYWAAESVRRNHSDPSRFLTIRLTAEPTRPRNNNRAVLLIILSGRSFASHPFGISIASQMLGFSNSVTASIFRSVPPGGQIIV